MKNFILLFSLILFAKMSLAQSDTLFYEDFNSPNWSLSRSFVPPSSTFASFEYDSVVFKGASGGSAWDTVGIRNTTYLTSPKISLRNNNGMMHQNIEFLFDQICYIDIFDQAVVEYKLDAQSWKSIKDQEIFNGNLYNYYTGNSFLQQAGNIYFFSKLSNALWPNINATFVYDSTNSAGAWAHESFDISRLLQWEAAANNIPFASMDSIQIRLALIDAPQSPVGRSGTHTWWVDNFTVVGNIVVGIPEINEESFSIYPNPVDDQIELRGIDFNENNTYRIFSTNGVLVEEGRLDQSPLTVSFLEPGIYLLQLQSKDGGRMTRKFIKQ